MNPAADYSAAKQSLKLLIISVLRSVPLDGHGVLRHHVRLANGSATLH
jgi:hypothetical protein